MSAIRPVSPVPPAAPPVPFSVALSDGDRRVRDVLAAVVRQVPLGVAVVRRDRSIAYHNDELARILSLDTSSGASAVLEAMARADGSPFPGRIDPLDTLLYAGTPAVRQTVTMHRRDHSTVEACVTMAPIVDDAGPVVGAVIYVEDVTLKRDDVSLRKAFVGVLSHELRTPITSIYGGTQLLLGDRMPADVRAEVVHDIAAEAEQLHRLVEDLMALAQVEGGVMRPGRDPVLVHRLAAQAAMAEERRWPGHSIVVHAAPGIPAIRGDEGYVLQVLRNLVSNAVKYSSAEDPVVVDVTADDETVNVIVRDRGPGFPPETGPDAFRLFYRSPDVAARVPGTGIGLYVARALVEAQGGRIWLSDREGGGAEVGFSLPIYGPDDEAT